MDGYYDYTPTMTLARPIAFVGFLGAGVADVASALSQRTGVPLVELPRWVEHAAGRSISALFLDEGEGGVRRHERALVARALKERPAAVVALGDGTLLDDEAREQLRRHATLVYVKRALPTLLDAIRGDLAASPGCHPEWMLAAPTRVEDLHESFERRRPGYESAHVTIDAGRLPGATVAGHVLSALRAGRLESMDLRA